ncbi:MAG: YCF48-related protein [Sinobacteraceae bacterium]|nr:YCF48-related protein [Nevskiaceae bacterium]
MLLRSGTTHEALFAVAFEGQIGVAVGATGAILASTDGGKHWKRAPSAPTPLALLGVALAPGHALIVGQKGTILTMDAQGRWQPQVSGTEERLFGVSVNEAGRAVAVGAFGTLLVSDDGGQRWRSAAPNWAQYFPNGEQPHLYAAKVSERGIITVAGEFGLILRSDDGGVTWRTLHQGDASLFSLDLREDGGGYAVGQNGTILRTEDGGKTWSELATETRAILLGVWSDVHGRVVVTGMHELLMSADGGRTWQRPEGDMVTANWFADVQAAPTTSEILAVGRSAQIVRVFTYGETDAPE